MIRRALLVLALAAPALAQEAPPQAWMILAEHPLPAQRQTARLPLNGIKGTFDHLRLGVAGAPVELQKLTVHFGNGETQSAEVNQTVAPGEFTTAVELPSKLQRMMVRLDVSYAAQPGARIKVYGAADRWVTLGQGTVGASAETHTIEVGAGQFRFDRARLSVEESGLQLQGVTFHFTSGAPQPVKFFGLQGKNSLTRVVDFTGGARVISKVELSYKALNPNATPPVVTVFAHTAGTWEEGGTSDDQQWQKLGQGLATLAKGEAEIRGLGLRGMVNTKLKVQIEGKQELLVNEIVIVFGNKDRQTVAVNRTIQPGGDCGVIELEGTTKRAIHRLKLRYAPQKVLGVAKVVVFGQ